MPDQIGAHTKGHNSDSLGICFVGNFDLIVPPDFQWKAGLRLVRFLCHEYKIDISNVYGHKEFADKSCPGLMFDLEKFKSEI